MGTIICQQCEETIEHFEDEKVTVLYSTQCNCSAHQYSENK